MRKVLPEAGGEERADNLDEVEVDVVMEIAEMIAMG